LPRGLHGQFAQPFGRGFPRAFGGGFYLSRFSGVTLVATVLGRKGFMELLLKDSAGGAPTQQDSQYPTSGRRRK